MRAMALALAGLCASACASSAPSPPRAAPVALPPVAGEMRSRSGIHYVEVAEGRGAQVSRVRCVYAHYTGWLVDGTQFETSRSSSQEGIAPGPVAFVQGTGKVMPGWEAGFEGMRAGGKRRLFIPFRLAYGAKGNPPLIPARTDLVFDVELLAVQDAVRSQCPPLRS